jgi:amidohydrolase
MRLGITLTFILVVITLSAVSSTAQQPLDPLIDQQIGSLVATYKRLHAAPELSHHEEKTSAFFAAELRALGYTVTDHFGKYERPQLTGYGVVAVMKNGPGRTLFVRTDLDALPVEEKTGLPYASTVRAKNDLGQEVPVMHACGHDIHVTTMLGTARLLAQLKDRWSGTLVIIGQPAEEVVDGAKSMLADGLYTKFSRPDFVIALHDSADIAAGRIGYTPGYAMASSTSVDIKLRGVGGHGSRPDATKDPVVLAAQVILALQTIVSRENSPLDPAVITVGSIHGGTKHNIIPDEVNLQITVRAYREEVRLKLLASIERIAKGIAIAAGIPNELAPLVVFSPSEYTPSMYNDPALSERLGAAFVKALGADNVMQVPQIMASEDFSRYSLEGHQIPSMIFWLGAVDPPKVKLSEQTGTPLPSLHSALFAPLPEPTIRTGVKAMTSAVLELLKK